MKINHFLPFVPSRNLKVSRDFYLDLGFEIVWEDQELVRFRSGQFEFFLQDFYVKELADNYITHLNIDDLENTYNHFRKIVEKYKDAKITEPKQEFYGFAFKIKGPSGELWDIVKGTQK